MFVLRIGVGEVHKRLHKSPVLDEKSIHIARSFPSSLLPSKEHDGFSIPRILRLLIIFMLIWGRD